MFGCQKFAAFSSLGVEWSKEAVIWFKSMQKSLLAKDLETFVLCFTTLSENTWFSNKMMWYEIQYSNGLPKATVNVSR